MAHEPHDWPQEISNPLHDSHVEADTSDVDTTYAQEEPEPIVDDVPPGRSFRPNPLAIALIVVSLAGAAAAGWYAMNQSTEREVALQDKLRAEQKARGRR